MELCLKLGASPNLTVWNGEYKAFLKPIQIAAFTKHIKSAELLVRYCADVNKTGSWKQPSALSIAFTLQDTLMSRLLLDSGANANQRFEFDRANQRLNIIEDIGNFNEPWFTDFSPLSILVANIWKPAEVGNSHVEFLKEVLDRAAKDSPSESLHQEHLDQLILFAVANCSPVYFRDVIQTLIGGGGNINTESIEGILPISLASQRWSDLCSTLLSLDAKPSLPHTSRYFHIRPAALHRAALNGDIATVKALLEVGADVDHYVTLESEDLYVNCEILMLELWEFELQNMPFACQCLQRYHTPLQFALGFSNSRMGHLSIGPETKAQVAHLLLSHGAKLFGGEMVDAVELGDFALVRLLHTKYGAPLDDKCAYGFTPVQEAIRSGFDEILKFLVDSGAKLEGCEVSQATIAERPGQLLKYLESHQATFNQERRGVHGGYEILKAFATGKEDIISQVLLLWPIHYDPSALCAIVEGFQKCTNKRRLTQLIEEFLERKPSPMLFNIENTAIAMAALSGNTEILKIFLRTFTLIQSQICFLPFELTLNLLYSAFTEGREQAIASCLKRDWVDVIRKPKGLEYSPLVTAVANGSEEIVELLLQHGFCPDAVSILLTIRLDRRNLLMKLLREGADINLRDSRIDSPLQMAVRFNRTEIFQLLLELKVDVNSDPPPARWGVSFEPRTALQHAVESGNVDLVHRLIDAGANINASAAHDSGATSLQLAAAKGYIGLAKLLIEHGADINADGARKSGRTALEIAAEHGRIDIVHFFLNHFPGALTEDDHAHQYIRAVTLAERNGHMAAAMVLRNFRSWTLQDFELYEKYKGHRGQEDESSEDESGEDLDGLDDMEDASSDSEDG